MTKTTDGNDDSSSVIARREGHHPLASPNPIAALIRRGAVEAGRLQGTSRASSKVQRMINSLQWRQAHSKDAIYPLALESGAVVEIKQLQAGEITGLGTGATVWPAAHVLAKYLERSDTVHVLTYDWGMVDDELAPPVDVVLVSDCVLPKLYPIEPLVDAIDRLSGPETVTIMSYEHRHYQAFDPRRRFEELAAARGLVKTDIPQAQQHPIFSADDIEIWEVRRRQPEHDPSRASSAAAPGETEAEVEMVDAHEEDVVILSQPQPLSWDNIEAPATSPEVKVAVGMLGERHELAQAPSGAIGCYLWPSAVVMARHLVAANAGGCSDAGASYAPLYPCRASVLELGSGVGLVAMAAALLGWDVVCTDKVDALQLLEANVKRCLSSTKRTCVGAADVVEYDWGTDAEELLERRTVSSGGIGYDIVICADCVYARSSVEPLLATLCQVCDENTIVLVTNELRSAFDTFLQRAKEQFDIESLHVSEDQMVVDPASNQRPTPVALKRLRRRILPPSSDERP
eukprot:jgi/Undpi1/995/HiC_scaffold_10.g04459.m1